jgi:hypothetical protein
MRKLQVLLHYRSRLFSNRNIFQFSAVDIFVRTFPPHFPINLEKRITQVSINNPAAQDGVRRACDCTRRRALKRFRSHIRDSSGRVPRLPRGTGIKAPRHVTPLQMRPRRGHPSFLCIQPPGQIFIFEQLRTNEEERGGASLI